MGISNLHILLDRYLTGDLTASEKVELASMVDVPENQAALEKFVEDILVSGRYADDANSGSNIKEKLFASLNDPQLNLEESRMAVRRIKFLKTAWVRYAAAIIVTLGVSVVAYLWSTDDKTEQTLTNSKKELQPDVAPGEEKAILTLADGSKILLDDLADGQVAVQDGIEVLKKDGQIIYDPENISPRNVVYNTMSTPRGGQYKLTLPDGTLVWLNAATSLTYPIAFVGKERKVKISGEAYFEVKKNTEKPFIVDIDGKSTVEVLGTRFNINSYPDESSIQTTLLEGSVRVQDKSSGSGDLSFVIKPGQQAILPNNTIAVEASSIRQAEVIDADIATVMAWKNGLFNFTNADFRSVMRQLERWYDIKVHYEGKLPDITLEGKMYRNVNLSTVLSFLQRMGVKSRIDGKTVIVSDGQ